MNLSFMDTETTSQIFARVSRERQRMEDTQTEAEASDAEEGKKWSSRHLYLCEVEQALETVGGFLNGEHAEFCEKRDSGRSDPDREVFNTP